MISHPRPIRLHVNIDHVATVRNARGTFYPDPIEAAAACIAAGADGITAHLREDRRHIRDADVERIRTSLRTTFNFEMAATNEMVAIATRVKPDVVTLVPERREERTTEGGLEVAGAGPDLARHVAALRDAGVKVSLFIAADPRQIEASAALGVQQIELHTGEYAHASTPADLARELARLVDGAALASKVGLEVAAGHGLTRANVGALMTAREIVELNIGHAIIADAIFLSIAGAVREMRSAIDAGVAAR